MTSSDGQSDRSRNSDEPSKEEIAEYIANKAQENPPFDDSNINEAISVCRTKIDRNVTERRVLDDECLSERAKKRRRERMEEIEKAKRRREERAIQDEQIALAARQRAKAAFEELEERGFEFDRTRIRAQIRLCKGRAKPIDLLILNQRRLDYLSLDVESMALFKEGLTVGEIKELHDDVKMHLIHLECKAKTPEHVIKYWEALDLLVTDWIKGFELELHKNIEIEDVDEGKDVE